MLLCSRLWDLQNIWGTLGMENMVKGTTYTHNGWAHCIKWLCFKTNTGRNVCKHLSRQTLHRYAIPRFYTHMTNSKSITATAGCKINASPFSWGDVGNMPARCMTAAKALALLLCTKCIFQSAILNGIDMSCVCIGRAGCKHKCGRNSACGNNSLCNDCQHAECLLCCRIFITAQQELIRHW